MRTGKHIVEDYLERAEGHDVAGEPSRKELHRSMVPVLPDGPRIYSGGATPPSQGTIVGEMIAVRNRRVTKRRVSPFNMVLVLIGAAVVIVLYISNVIAVGRLLGEINLMDQRYQRLVNEQEILRAQVNRMSSLERIRKLAEEDLGLRNPTGPPEWLDLDPDRTVEWSLAVEKKAEGMRRQP